MEIEHHKLNKVIVKNSKYPISKIDELFDQL